ncbi:MAG: DUF1653 domain-containing protein [Acetatifactor sp.]
MSFIPKVHEIYKHFKGGLYQITAIAEHTETGEQLVVYQALYGDFKTYARPLEMFTGKVDRSRYPEAEQEYRFELQGPEADRQKAEADSRGAEAHGADKQRPEAERQNPGAENRSSEVDGKGTGNALQEPGEGELALDPLVLEFLDTDSYEQKLNILAALHHRITDDMLTTMAIACDVEVNEGDTEERYESLKTCILTLEKYECNRIR